MLNFILQKIMSKPGVRVHGNHATSTFRRCQNGYLRDYCGGLNAKTILNVGAVPDSSDKEGSYYEAYFRNAEFFTLDMAAADHPRHIVADVTDLNNVDQIFDLVLMMSVLEHVDKPFLAAERLRDLIAEEGYLYLALPFFYPVHKGNDFGDYWRFTPAAVAQMFDYCDVLKLDHYPSVIRTVDDRANYWTDVNSCYTGFSVLLQRRRNRSSQAA